MTNQNLMTIEEVQSMLLAEANKQQAAMPSSSSTTVQLTRDGFKLPNGSTSDLLTAAIVDLRYVNGWYPKKYVPGQLTPPACYAINRSAHDLAPDCDKPVNETCNGCPKNEWGSSGGRGKECKNMLRLGLLPIDATIDTPVLIMTLPPTSMGGFIKCMEIQLNAKHPLQTLIFDFTFDDKVDYPKVISKVNGRVPDSLLPIVFNKMNDPDVIARLDRGYIYD